MGSYVGIIRITSVSNSFSGQGPGINPADPLTIDHTRFIHYPDCQQLVIWLPVAGRNYGAMRLVNTGTQEVLEEGQVADQLSGSIQLIRDTLYLPPGEYTIRIDRNDGWQHQVDFRKYPETERPPEPVVERNGEKVEDPGPITYRDGFGNLIENEDLLLREKLKKEMMRKFSRRISYTGNARSGSIIFTDGVNRLEFYHEMGGGDCMFYVDIPSAAAWEKQTGLPLGEREELITYIAETVGREQAPSCRYEIGETSIIYYRK